jgi:hypothetical protein
MDPELVETRLELCCRGQRCSRRPAGPRKCARKCTLHLPGPSQAAPPASPHRRSPVAIQIRWLAADLPWTAMPASARSAAVYADRRVQRRQFPDRHSAARAEWAHLAHRQEMTERDPKPFPSTKQKSRVDCCNQDRHSNCDRRSSSFAPALRSLPQGSLHVNKLCEVSAPILALWPAAPHDNNVRIGSCVVVWTAACRFRFYPEKRDCLAAYGTSQPAQFQPRANPSSGARCRI